MLRNIVFFPTKREFCKEKFCLKQRRDDSLTENACYTSADRSCFADIKTVPLFDRKCPFEATPHNGMRKLHRQAKI